MGKVDVRKELNTRKYKQTPRPYYWFYRTVMKVVGKKYNAHFEIIDDINKEKGSCFVIFNHLSRIDHFYVNEICYPKKVNMLAGYNEFFRSHLHFAFKMNNILPKKNYANDILGTRAISTIIKKGGSVSFAPEGLATNDGMNKPIVPKTGHMLKHYGVPVYFVELRGQYLQNTKVCLDERYGETYASIRKLFTPEDLKNMTVDEIDDKINSVFTHDELSWQKEKHIKWLPKKENKDRMAYRLNDLLFTCPKCKSFFSMECNKNTIKCKNCGNGATVDEYYDMHKLDDTCVIPETQSNWSRLNRMAVIKQIRENPDFSFTEKVKIGRLPLDHLVKDHKTSEVVSEGILTIDHNGFRYNANKTEEEQYNFDLSWKQLYTLVTELDSSFFDLYVNGEFTDVFPERNTSIYILYLVEEMHRLHVNFYKPLKTDMYMYEGYDKLPNM